MSKEWEFPRMMFGLPRPTNKEEITRQATIDGMRQAIEHGAYDSSLIRGCLMSARANGLSGEDTHVMLAYQALLLLEEHYQRNLEWVMLNPAPKIVTDPQSRD